MRLAWLTDIHLDFVGDGGAALWRKVASANPDAVLVTGDIAVAATVRSSLERAAVALGRPIYFVLGNHDFYGGSIAGVRDGMRDVTRTSMHLRWLPEAGVVSLGGGVAIVGHDGWADERIGDVAGSPIALNDWVLIEELACLPRSDRIARLRTLGDEAATHFGRVLPLAAAEHTHIIALLHPPPFAEACRYYGVRSPDEWLPHLVCAAAGEAILAIAGAFPDRRFTVLCGHTHGRAHFRPRANVEVSCGSAAYGKPVMQRLIET